MEKLGYIVSKNKVKNLRSFVGVVDDISLADPNKPILVVGLNEAKKLSKDFSILNKKIKENLFWTFAKNERRVDYDRDILYFYKYIILYILNNIKYKYINILTLRYNNIKILYNIIFSNEKKYIYINNDMFYFLYKKDVLGISLRMLKYSNINVDKFLKRIKNNKNNIICEDDSFLSVKLKKDIGNNKYVIPYFMKIE